MADSTPTLDMLCTAVASCPGPDRNTTSGKWSYPAQLLHADALAYYIHTHTRLMALCPGLPGWAGTRKVKPIWILLKQETVSGSGFSWDICKSAPRSRQTTMPAHQAAPHRSVFFQAGCPSCRSTNSVKALKAVAYYILCTLEFQLLVTLI